MKGAILAGNTANYGEPDDEPAAYDPRAILDHLSASARSPLRLAPVSVTDRLVQFLESPDSVFDLFEHVATGNSLREFADERQLPYFALVALYESPTQPFTTMRKLAAKAVSREDREKARQAIRERFGFVSDGRKRYADAMLALSKAEDPEHYTPPATNRTTQVQVGVSFGETLAQHHRAARASAHVRVLEHQQAEPVDDIL